MSFNLARENGTDKVTLNPIRLKACENFFIDIELSFDAVGIDLSAGGIVASDNKVTSITYRIHKDTLDPETRKTERRIREASADYRKMSPEERAAKKTKALQIAAEQQKKQDEVLIDRAKKAIKERERTEVSLR